jgi:hypothetical protein
MSKPRTFTFTIGGVAGVYASEIFYFAADDALPKVNQKYEAIDDVVVTVTDLPTSSQYELDLLDEDGTWRTNCVTYDALGTYERVFLKGMRGARIRAKSGGSAGTGRIMVLF